MGDEAKTIEVTAEILRGIADGRPALSLGRLMERADRLDEIARGLRSEPERGEVDIDDILDSDWTRESLRGLLENEIEHAARTSSYSPRRVEAIVYLWIDTWARYLAENSATRPDEPAEGEEPLVIRGGKESTLYRNEAGQPGRPISLSAYPEPSGDAEPGEDVYQWPPLESLPRADAQAEPWVVTIHEEIVTALIREETGEWYYLARWRHPDIVGFYGDGETRREAVDSLMGATDAMLQAYNDDDFMRRPHQPSGEPSEFCHAEYGYVTWRYCLECKEPWPCWRAESRMRCPDCRTPPPAGEVVARGWLRKIERAHAEADETFHVDMGPQPALDAVPVEIRRTEEE